VRLELVVEVKRKDYCGVEGGRLKAEGWMESWHSLVRLVMFQELYLSNISIQQSWTMITFAYN
jgi:hypothetical protein